VAPQNTPDQLLQALARQLDLVMLSRDRIQQTLDEAAERGRVTRSDANLLVTELVRRGRTQTDDLIKELEELVGRGRDKARRVVGAGGAFPIAGYDDLTAAKIRSRLGDLSPEALRQVRDYERSHANRKTVLQAIERTLA
jgi:polyhydroxyalkanoate synthesis regulator phasin